MSQESTVVKTTGSAPTKKLINSPETSVDENLRGLVAVYPQLSLHPKKRLITTQQVGVVSSVAVISGGGSGHEPFAAGYVGKGMLSGAVSGGIFTSPPSSHILHAITYLHKYNKGGVLVVIPNYTGDRLNFGMAIEKARNAGLKVDSIIVDEDLASGQNTSAGARGMCGLAIVYKVCGALAAEGAQLSRIQQTAADILNNMATFGVSLRACSVPGQAPLFHISEDEMELGTGVHGEAGVCRTKLGSAAEVVQQVLARLTTHLDVQAGSRVVVLVNNMGGTTTLEMNIVCAEVALWLKNKGIRLERLYSGHVMTCLDMHGFQVNMVHLTEASVSEWLRLLDAETDAPAWTGCAMSIPSAAEPVLPDENLTESFTPNKGEAGPELDRQLAERLGRCLRTAAEALVSAEARLNRLDAGCGDGDCGSTLRNLAQAVLKYISTEDLSHPSVVLSKLSEIAESDMGGTSGGIYSLGFAAASRVMSGEKTATAEVWSQAWNSANEAITKYGRAKLRDRTMVDALVPAAAAFQDSLNKSWNEAVQNTITAVENGAKSTASMKAGAGRASYVGEQHLGGEDAGARGAAVWITALMRCLNSS